MVIIVKNHTPNCNTNAEGHVLYRLITSALRTGAHVVVDFSGVPNVTSSFVNSAFVPLLDKYSFDTIKRLVSVKRAHPQIASMIRSRLNFESSRAAA